MNVALKVGRLGWVFFLTMWFGQVVSLLGSQMTDFALGVWVFEGTRSATQFALIIFFVYAPAVILSPLADTLFNPLFFIDGPLAGSFLAEIFGLGPGRGIGFMFSAAGPLTAVVALAGLAYPRLRQLQQETPDAQMPDLEERSGPQYG